jgi:MoxR-like ATPase
MFERFTGTDEYIAASELRDSVNVAIAIGRPLLIKGEPGTGKTLLAHAIAKGLNMPLFTWHVKSTSKAQDGLYVYDTVQRLNDSRFGDGDVADIGRYIKMGPAGQAFRCEEQSVLLLDEIDKADLEFPNDLLHELDVMSFRVLETDEVVKAVHRPVVVITSNNEKELPDAFLRRCVFHWIAFPDHDLMRRIVAVHHPDVEERLVTQCLDRFYWIREQQEVRKRPSTSELIDWIAALIRSGADTRLLEEQVPFLGVLLKNERDEAAVSKQVARRAQRRAVVR